ncbi:unnamed protein product [Larinioides sclopetarius]|uniref:Uncharacterized protein n=1 Tax=Larinioides sclopetarius TaxID=280406 RepID=A0AAV2BPA3_9ARAC
MMQTSKLFFFIIPFERYRRSFKNRRRTAVIGERLLPYFKNGCGFVRKATQKAVIDGEGGLQIVVRLGGAYLFSQQNGHH